MLLHRLYKLSIVIVTLPSEAMAIKSDQELDTEATVGTSAKAILRTCCEGIAWLSTDEHHVSNICRH